MQTAYVDGVLIRIKATNGRSLRYRVSVASNELSVCVPARTSAKTLTDFVIGTIREKREEEVFNDYRDGGYLYLFGEKKTIRAYPSDENRYRVSSVGEDVFIGTPKNAKTPVDVAVKRFYEKELEKKLKARVPAMEAYVGLTCAGWKISGYHAAWGKCLHTAKTITFSLDLATQTQQFIDTVIIHELGHLLYPDHGADFQTYMKRFAPDHRRILKNALK